MDDPYLSLFPVQIAKGATRLESVQGFAFEVPVSRHVLQFELAEIQGKSRKSAGLVTLVPLGIEKANNRLTVGFQLFRPTPELKKSPVRKTARSQKDDALAAAKQNIAERESSSNVFVTVRGQFGSGPKIPPSGYQSVSSSMQKSSSKQLV